MIGPKEPSFWATSRLLASSSQSCFQQREFRNAQKHLSFDWCPKNTPAFYSIYGGCCTCHQTSTFCKIGCVWTGQATCSWMGRLRASRTSFFGWFKSGIRLFCLFQNSSMKGTDEPSNRRDHLLRHARRRPELRPRTADSMARPNISFDFVFIFYFNQFVVQIENWNKITLFVAI